VESQQRLMALSEQASAADQQTCMPRVPQRHQLTLQERTRITPVPDAHRHRRTPSRDKDTVVQLLGAHQPKPKAQVCEQQHEIRPSSWVRHTGWKWRQ
jgi:DNA uptake protein ComE-like DNA-binding protein